MANMFEKAVESYDKALELEPLYLDAVSSRGSARIILGQYPEAAQDFVTVLETDERRRFQVSEKGFVHFMRTQITKHTLGIIPGQFRMDSRATRFNV
jgi:tetratricopeptide (TPR) repeat protein